MTAGTPQKGAAKTPQMEKNIAAIEKRMGKKIKDVGYEELSKFKAAVVDVLDGDNFDADTFHYVGPVLDALVKKRRKAELAAAKKNESLVDSKFQFPKLQLLAETTRTGASREAAAEKLLSQYENDPRVDRLSSKAGRLSWAVHFEVRKILGVEKDAEVERALTNPANLAKVKTFLATVYDSGGVKFTLDHLTGYSRTKEYQQEMDRQDQASLNFIIKKALAHFKMKTIEELHQKAKNDPAFKMQLRDFAEHFTDHIDPDSNHVGGLMWFSQLMNRGSLTKSNK